MNFYNTLKKAMDMKGLKAADLCKATGIDSSYFSRLKSGYMKSVTWEKALVIIAALGMTPDEFAALSNEGVEEVDA